MTVSPREVVPFVRRCDALLVNLGMFDVERQKAALAAIPVANKKRTPWVLDPVYIDSSAPRAAFAKRLVAKKPTALRLNEHELAALGGNAKDLAAFTRHAARIYTVIGLTGERDFVSDGTRLSTISNGDPMMAKVTAMGCAGSAVVAASGCRGRSVARNDRGADDVWRRGRGCRGARARTGHVRGRDHRRAARTQPRGAGRQGEGDVMLFSSSFRPSERSEREPESITTNMKMDFGFAPIARRRRALTRLGARPGMTAVEMP